MRDTVVSAQRPELLLITRYFRTTSTASIQVLACALLLDLQVEKEYLLMHGVRLNRDLNYCPIHFSVDEIQRKVKKIRYHP